jgi:hypothetical protein
MRLSRQNAARRNDGAGKTDKQKISREKHGSPLYLWASELDAQRGENRDPKVFVSAEK